MKGRKPIPQETKIAHGNPGKRPEDVDRSTQPQPARVMPKPPAYLSLLARSEWERMTDLLFRNKLLTEIDGEALALYCQSWARMVDAEKKFADGGSRFTIIQASGNEVKNPLLAVIEHERETIVKLLREFGMTPAARCRVKGPPGTFEGSDDDKWAAFAKRRTIQGGKQ